MLIPVIYPDGRHDLVKDFYLSYLIEQNNIAQFKRKEGWVSVYAADIRGKGIGAGHAYQGPERRAYNRELH